MPHTPLGESTGSCQGAQVEVSTEASSCVLSTAKALPLPGSMDGRK